MNALFLESLWIYLIYIDNLNSICEIVHFVFIRHKRGRAKKDAGIIQTISKINRRKYHIKTKDPEAGKISGGTEGKRTKYRTIIQSIQEGYLETDLAGKWIFVNDIIPKLLGYTRKELWKCPIPLAGCKLKSMQKVLSGLQDHIQNRKTAEIF